MGNFCEGCCRGEEAARDERVSLLHGEGSEGSGAGRNGGGLANGGDAGGGVCEGGRDWADGAQAGSKGSTDGARGQKDRQSAEYFQSILDDASNKFISSSTSRPYSQSQTGNQAGVEELRHKLASAVLSPALLRSEPYLAAPAVSTLYGSSHSSSGGGLSSFAASGSAGRPGTLQQQVVIDVLSDPANQIVSSQIMVAIDEVAELVGSAFAFKVNDGDGVTSVVSKFI